MYWKRGVITALTSSCGSIERFFILTKTAVELQATVGGTKYWKDDALN